MTQTLPRTKDVVVEIDPIADPRWRQLAEAGDVFHSPAWLRVLQETYGFEFKARIVEEESGQVRAGLVYATIDDFLGTRIISLPFTDFCDPLVESSADWTRLIEAPIATGHRIHLRCLHNQHPAADERFIITGQGRWHSIDLLPDIDESWRRLHPTARRAVRKAQMAGVEISIAQDQAELIAFYQLHLRVRKHKYGLLVQPQRFFINLWEEFFRSGLATLLLARVEGEIVAGVLFLRWGDTLYYKFNASSPDYLEVRPNDLILWEAIRHATGEGLRTIDLGHTDWDHEGLVRYKEKYATTEEVIRYVRRIPPEAPGKNEVEARALLAAITDLLVLPEVPDHLSGLAGDLMYRYFV